MNQRDYRWLVVFGSNLLLLWLYGLGNHALGDYGVYLYPGGLLTVYAALRLDVRNGYLSTVLTGFACDALMPVPFGTSVALLAFVHTTVFYGRQRFPREEPIFATVAALVANLFLFLVLSFFLVARNPRPAGAWLRLFSDLIASQLVLGLITPWFWALQNRTFALLRQNPETARRTSA